MSPELKELVKALNDAAHKEPGPFILDTLYGKAAQAIEHLDKERHEVAWAVSGLTSCTTDGHNTVRMVEALKTSAERREDDLRAQVKKLESQLVLAQAGEAGAGSMLLDIQQECIAIREERDAWKKAADANMALAEKNCEAAEELQTERDAARKDRDEWVVCSGPGCGHREKLAGEMKVDHKRDEALKACVDIIQNARDGGACRKCGALVGHGLPTCNVCVWHRRAIATLALVDKVFAGNVRDLKDQRDELLRQANDALTVLQETYCATNCVRDLGPNEHLAKCHNARTAINAIKQALK